MTQEEIVKYTDHLLAEFYKGCPKQLNKEKRQVDIVLTDGDFSTLQNIMCEAIINAQNQFLDDVCKFLDDHLYTGTSTGDYDYGQEYIYSDFDNASDLIFALRKAMGE